MLNFLKRILFIFFLVVILNGILGSSKSGKKENIVTVNTPKNSTLSSLDISSQSGEASQSNKPAKSERKLVSQENKKNETPQVKRVVNKVVITARGKKYHLPDCRTIKKYARTLTVAQAKKKRV